MEEYLEFAKKLANEAEEIALKYFSFEIETEWKKDDSPLTKADTEINNLVIEKVNALFPDHSIYGEEKSDVKQNSKYIWVCDPIDGTMPFSNGLPIFTFSLALVDQSNGQPILGIANDPIMKNMYWAYKGSGAYRNNKRIFTNKDSSLKNTYLNCDGSGNNTGFSYGDIFKVLNKKEVKVMRFGSIVYGGIQVSNGKFGGTIFLGKYGHDIAALKIITEEAGGKVTDLNGNERRYDQEGLGCVISNNILHDELLAVVKIGKL